MRVLAAFGLLGAAIATPASAASGTLWATGITSPGGSVWLGSHLWIADHANGFCRMDATATGAQENLATCVGGVSSAGPASPGQPAYDPATNFVYVPDNSVNSSGVWRMPFDPTLERIGTPQIVAPGKGLAGNRPTAVALGSDGSLYVGFIKSGSIVRVPDAAGVLSTQSVVAVGNTSDARGVSGLAFASGKLYIAEKTGFTAITNPAACTGGCKPTTFGSSATAPTALIAVGADTLYVADTPAGNSTVLRYTISTGAEDIYANSGTDAQGKVIPFTNTSSLGIDPTSDLFVSSDPSAGAGAGGASLFMIAAGQAPIQAGTGAAVVNAPAPVNGTLYADGLTNAPATWMGTHLWVSDAAQGFCRVDVDPVTGAGAINGATCDRSALTPGQATFDPATNFVYVPDTATGAGVFRLAFDPTTQSVSGATIMAPGKGLGGPLANLTALGPDGNLYVSFQNSGNIVRVPNPAGPVANQVVITVGGSFGGHGPNGLAFSGANLYLGEGNITVITNATSPTCTGGCKAVLTNFSLADAAQMTASQGVLYVADTPRLGTSTIYRVDPASKAVWVTSSGSASGGYQVATGLAVDGAGHLFVTTDPSRGKPAFLGKAWQIALPVLP